MFFSVKKRQILPSFNSNAFFLAFYIKNHFVLWQEGKVYPALILILSFQPTHPDTVVITISSDKDDKSVQRASFIQL
jgi:hypothetical protein